MGPVVYSLLLVLGFGCAAARDICTEAEGPPIIGGSLEAHIEEREVDGSAPKTCKASVKRPSQMSRIKVTSVMFSLGDRCSQQQAVSGCSAIAANYLLINDREVCTCRSADEHWQPFYAGDLSVEFHRASPSAASFSVTYRVQSCDLDSLRKYGSYEAVEVVTFDRAAVYCKVSSLIDAYGNPTNRTLATCHFENGTWEHTQRCDEKGSISDGDELPPSQEVSQHKPSHFHTDDDGDGHFPKELVGGLAFVLVILVVVVIGATIYTVKRRYKVIVVRRPSRAGSANSRRGSSLTNGGLKAARLAGGGQGEDDARTAEERLLPPVRPSVYGPTPTGAFVGVGGQRADGNCSHRDGDGEHEYATPFDPAVGTWSLPSGLQTGLSTTPAAAVSQTGSAAAMAVDEKVHYFVLEGNTMASP